MSRCQFTGMVHECLHFGFVGFSDGILTMPSPAYELPQCGAFGAERARRIVGIFQLNKEGINLRCDLDDDLGHCFWCSFGGLSFLGNMCRSRQTIQTMPRPQPSNRLTVEEIWNF
jgi:hypothetical protein